MPQYFLRKFTALGRDDILFVAPEGLHRYYLGGTSGRVGSSWMTKEERETDIDDYRRMLDQVADEVIESAAFEKRAVLGFSQGVATACRWTVTTIHQIDELINWAGAFPPDLDYDKAFHDLQDIPIRMLVGDNDEYITEEDYQEHLDFLRSKKLEFSSRVFHGGHDLPAEVLKEVLEEVFPEKE